MPPIAAATVPVAKSSLTRTAPTGQVQVRVHVDAAGHEQPARCSRRPARRLERRERVHDRGDAAVASDAHVGAPLAVDVEHGAVREQHALG